MYGLLKNFLQKLMYGGWGDKDWQADKSLRYRRLWVAAVMITTLVSIIPLMIMTAANYYQYKKTMEEEITFPIYRLTTSQKRALEFALQERLSALRYIVNDEPYESLTDENVLNRILKNLKESFGEFVDIGVVDSKGDLLTYIGPYDLKNVNYSRQDWFGEVAYKGHYISDVFMGYRDFPHFVIAVKSDKDPRTVFFLRATIDTNILKYQITSEDTKQAADAFIINRGGILQTKSRSGKGVLKKSYLPVPPASDSVEVIDQKNERGEPYKVGYAYIQGTPFIFVMAQRAPDLMRNWLRLRSWIMGLLIISIFIILILTMIISSILVSRIREADLRHEKALHQMEFTNKMASIGRLAAGVAHEINNPLAIINEKAGLLKDFFNLGGEFPRKEKSINAADTIISSVERCSAITHRLLGFARHMNVSTETVNLKVLIEEVLGFLEKEASFRSISIETFIEDDLPQIESDRGQLQQVLLNVINNAFGALPKGGRIGIMTQRKGENEIEIEIHDNGVGIPKEDLGRIFEPFYTTKADGTGLGLSITYGIIRKLKGKIDVESEVGKGTKFNITLPIKTK
ncbi:MAG: ATP-binding protein [bacterium]